MADWREYVQTNLKLTGVSPEQEIDAIEEVALQLEDAYTDARNRGLAETEAEAIALQHISDWKTFAEELQRTNRYRSSKIVEVAQGRLGVGAHMSVLAQDLIYAGRLLRRENKAWTVVIILSLALGIGANTALFTVVNEMFMRKLPVRDPDTLVRLQVAGQNDMITSWLTYGYMPMEGDFPVIPTFSYSIFEHFLEHNQTLDDMTASAPIARVNLLVDGVAEIVSAFVLSGNYYALLGVEPLIGRTITTDDDRPGAPPVAMISYGYWTRRFGRNAQVIGKTVRANSLLVTIVGITPPEFTGMSLGGEIPNISFPLALDSQLTAQSGARPRLSQPTYWWLNVTGRLKPGVTVPQVQENFEGVFRQSARAGMDEYLSSPDAQRRSPASNRERTQIPQLRVSSASRGLYDIDGDDVLMVGMVGAVVILLLLIVCANIASLLLSRAVARQKEISIRLSMGATRVRLIRQLLTESVMIALVGGVFGIVVAYSARQVWRQSTGPFLDWRVLGFTAGLAMLTGVVFGIAPAFRATGRNLDAALKQTSRSVIGTRSLAGKSLLMLQVAVSVVLLIGAGLFLRTLRNLRQVDVGFDPSNIVLFRLNPELNGYDQAHIRNLYQTIIERLRAEPGVLSVGLSNGALLSVGGNTWFIASHISEAGGQTIRTQNIGPGFLETMGIPVITGRRFTWQDDQSAPKVAIINEAAARKYFPNASPLGQRFGDQGSTTEYEIIGIIRDVKVNGPREPAPPTRYMPYLQRPLGEATFELKTAGDPIDIIAAVRYAVKQVDPNIPVTDLGTQVRIIEDRWLDREKAFAGMYAMFGGLALFLSSIGLFGLMSYSVTRRTNEIGIRMALGARSQDVVKMVMRESMLVVGIGVVVGVAGAFAAGRLVASLLFGLSPTDGVTIGAAILLIIIVSATAGYLPARRASRVDPLNALRYE